MSQATPVPYGCAPCPTACAPAQVPGSPGTDGTNGTPGAAGTNAFTTLAAGFTMPASGATVVADVLDSSWIVVSTNTGGPGEIDGTVVIVQFAGAFLAVSLPTSTSVELYNLGYTTNAPAGTAIPAGAAVAPGGLQGEAGSLSGIAGGDLQGNYPNPALVNTGAAGTYGDSTHVPVIVTDTAGRVTSATPTAIAFPASAAPSGAAGGDLTGTYPNPTLAASGVAAATYGSAQKVPQLAIDAKGRVTTATSIQPRVGLLGSLLAADFNSTLDQAIAINSSKYFVTAILVTNASVNLTTAQGGVYNAVGKPGGGILVGAAQVYTALTASGKALLLTLTGVALTDLQTAAFLYLSLTAGQGAAATADAFVFGYHLA